MTNLPKCDIIITVKRKREKEMEKRLQEIEKALFYFDMIDFQTREDKQQIAELLQEKKELMKKMEG